MGQLIPAHAPKLPDPSLAPFPSWVPPNSTDSDELITAAGLAGIVRRHWVIMLLTVALALAVAFLVTRLTAPVYRASTTLYFADHPGSIPALDLLNQIENGNSEVTTEMEVIHSRALAETVVDSLGLQLIAVEPKDAITSNYIQLLRADPFAPDNRFRFTRRAAGTFDVVDDDSGNRIGVALVDRPFTFGGVTAKVRSGVATAGSFSIRVRPRAKAVDEVLQAVKVSRPNPTASVVQVAYTSHDRFETKRVPDMLANAYLGWRSSLRKSGDRSTVEFLRRQIDTISTQLYAAEESLRRFREANQVVDLPTQAQSEVQRLAALEAQRTDINIQRASLSQLMEAVKSAPSDPRLGSPYRRLMAFPTLMTNSNPALPLLQTLTELEQRRTELLSRRTPADPDVQSLTRAITDVESQIAAVAETYLKGLDEQATALSTTLAQFHTQIDQVPGREVEFARLDRTATGLTQIYTMLQTRLREAQIAEAVDDDAVRVVDPSAMPIRPIAPRLVTNLLIGAILGLILAFALAIVRDRLDQTVHTKEEVESVSGAAVLALIPHIGETDRAKYFERWARIGRGHIARANGQPVARSTSHNGRLLVKDTQSVASEAFRKLRTNITFARPDAPPRVLIFTSPAPGDGKSTSVMNLAIALVQQGKRVIVLDADLRRGWLHKMVGGVQTPGLSEILVGQAELESAIQTLRLESIGSVDLLAMGNAPPNPAELLAAPRFRELIETLRPRYDAILIDSPPINLVTDAAIIGRESDGAVLVVRAAQTTKGELAHAVGQLRQIQVAVTGVILNDYDAKRDAGYNAPYHTGYSYDYRSYSYNGRSS